MGYSWVLQSGSASDVYFTYGEATFQYDTTTQVLVYVSNLVPHPNVLRTDLQLFASNTRVKVYDMNYLPNDLRQITGDIVVSIYGYIDVPVSTEPAYYITDGDGNVLLAFNKDATKLVDGKQRIYLNKYLSRDKKIYN